MKSTTFWDVMPSSSVEASSASCWFLVCSHFNPEEKQGTIKKQSLLLAS
jgi:hypothetical protein